eukprot:10693929-Lingulodinium_polyedra.AAC.1
MGRPIQNQPLQRCLALRAFVLQNPLVGQPNPVEHRARARPTELALAKLCETRRQNDGDVIPPEQCRRDVELAIVRRVLSNT